MCERLATATGCGPDGRALIGCPADDAVEIGRDRALPGAGRAPGIGKAERRSEHHAGDRDAVLDERDVDRELAVAADELLGAVERIDEQEGVPDLRSPCGGHFLLGDDRNVRHRRREGFHDGVLGAEIGFADRRIVDFVGDGKVGPVDLHDDARSRERGVDQVGEAWVGAGLVGHGVLLASQHQPCQRRLAATERRLGNSVVRGYAPVHNRAREASSWS